MNKTLESDYQLKKKSVLEGGAGEISSKKSRTR